MQENIEKLRRLLEIQGSDGNWNMSPYMTGLYNGMELALATMEGREPVYRDIQEDPPEEVQHGET